VADGDAYAMTFTHVKFTDDTTVTGTGTWDRATGHVTASVTATGPGGRQATLTISYDDYEPLPQAQVSGVSGGSALVTHLPAP
jgi:hypothetical protein